MRAESQLCLSCLRAFVQVGLCQNALLPVLCMASSSSFSSLPKCHLLDRSSLTTVPPGSPQNPHSSHLQLGVFVLSFIWDDWDFTLLYVSYSDSYLSPIVSPTEWGDVCLIPTVYPGPSMFLAHQNERNFPSHFI